MVTIISCGSFVSHMLCVIVCLLMVAYVCVCVCVWVCVCVCVYGRVSVGAHTKQ